jgi:rare lipoprotein A
MSSISVARTSHGDIQANGTQLTGPSTSATGLRNVIQLFAIVLGAASLAACAQSSVVTKNSGFVAASRQAALEHNRNAAETPVVSHGFASFYTEGTQTASGEKFDTHELTAAHPTLPFGTQLRVTNVATGRSVTVRVNDRGPFVRGRVVDVSYAAAERLRMVGAGVAKVKLDVVE